MVFRRDNKVDAFQRQMSSLRQQIGGSQPQESEIPDLEDEVMSQQEPEPRSDAGYSFGNTYTDEEAAVAEAQEVPVTDAPEIPAMPVTDPSVSIVAVGTFWKGELEAEGSIHAFGKVEGALRAKEEIWIAEGAEINATLHARRVVIGGAVSGTIRGVERFEALPTCSIQGDVNAPVFVVHEGAIISGNLRMSENSESRSERAPAIIQRRARTGA